MAKIILQGHIIVPEDELDVVSTELEVHTRLTKQEPGCLVFEVTVDKTNPCKFNVYEEFIDQDAFDNHQLRVASSNWGKVSKNVKRHYQITETNNRDTHLKERQITETPT